MADVSVDLDGVAGSGQSGTPTVLPSIAVAITGAAGTSAAGSMAPAAAASVSIVGVGSTGAAGRIKPLMRPLFSNQPFIPFMLMRPPK